MDGRLYQTFYYVRGLARAYRVSFIEIGRELLLLGSQEYVAFRLVRTTHMHSVASTHVRSNDHRTSIVPLVHCRCCAAGNCRLPPRGKPLTNKHCKQIADALLNNAVLKRVRFASRHFKKQADLQELMPALEASRHLREFAIWKKKMAHAWHLVLSGRR